MALALASVAASATALPTLKFELSDGSAVTLPSEALTIAFENNFMNINHSGGAIDIDLSRLTKFYFEGDFSSTTSIDTKEPERVKIFSLTGISHGEYQSIESAHAALTPGIYIARTESKTFKTVVR